MPSSPLTVRTAHASSRSSGGMTPRTSSAATTTSTQDRRSSGLLVDEQVVVALTREANRLVSRDPFAARDILGARPLTVVTERVDPGRADRRLALLEAFLPLPHEPCTGHAEKVALGRAGARECPATIYRRYSAPELSP